jgi:hypothetical protein
MIETEEQRRWWFATHPEYSWSARGIRSEGKVDPEEVDKYVDKALKYEKGPVADLLKSVKRNFGTQGYHCPDDGFDRCKEEFVDPVEPAKANDKAIEADPHTFLDISPYRKFVISPIQAFRSLLRGMARDQVLNAVKREGTRPPARLPPRGTPEYNKIKAARDKGVRLKQAEELNDIRGGGKGSGVWSEEELAAIRRDGEFPIDAIWHHNPTVANRPDLAADPRFVHPMRGGEKAHLRDGHGGNYQKPFKDEISGSDSN